MVVGGDEQRLPGVPATGGGADPAAGGAVPVAHAVGAVAVRAQQAVLLERRERALDVTRRGERRRARCRVDDVGAQTGVVVGELDLGRAARQHRQRRVGVAVAHGDRERRDGAAEAAAARQPHDAAPEAGPLARRERGLGGVVGGGQVGADEALERGVDGRRDGARDEVGEHRAGVDRGQLVGVADEHQSGVGTQRLEQPCGHRQRHHRRLVDDDHVVRQPVVGVVPEAGAAVGAPAEQPVQRHRRQRQPLLGHLLLQPRGRLAGRRRERDAGAGLLVEQQPQHAGDGERLAGARAARHHRRPTRHGERRRHALAVRRRLREVPGEPVREHLLVVRRAGGVARGEHLAHDLLLPPVAVEVQQRPLVGVGQPQRAQVADGRAGDERAAPQRRLQRGVVRPRQRRRVEVLHVHVAERAQVDAHGAQAHGPHGERRRQQHLVVALARERAQPARDVHVGGREHARLGEGAQQPGRRLRHEAHDSRSDSAGSRAGGGSQSKTPHPGGVAGPTMPRTNRYCTAMRAGAPGARQRR